MPYNCLIFTDLDGTLLDHHSYDWSPAAAMLRKLENAGIPVIFTTSKTLAELSAFREETQNRHPAIAENGGCYDLPAGWLSPDSHAETNLTAASRDRLHLFLADLPDDVRQSMTCFADMDTSGVVENTGLPSGRAAMANDRHCSEPFLWNGTDAGFDHLKHKADAQGLHILTGGRFYHLQSKIDKRDAMVHLADLVTSKQTKRPTLIALGDGPNDKLMLEAADIAITIPNHHGNAITLDPAKHPGQRRIIAHEPGPTGWAQSLSELDLV